MGTHVCRLRPLTGKDGGHMENVGPVGPFGVSQSTSGSKQGKKPAILYVVEMHDSPRQMK
jgi:hypothetical protein